MKQSDEERLRKIREYKAAHKEKQHEYFKRWYEKNKNKESKDYEKEVQKRIDYIISLFKKEDE